MRFSEQGRLFDCEGESLVGVVSMPEQPADVGVLIIVGGPQYRAGSHRQFVLVARDLARHGVASMRFDHRGMGDSTGAFRDFETIEADVGAAVAEFVAAVPQVRRVVLWGLCGGASAACLYAPLDPRVTGVILLNPWVRTDESEAKTYLKHYYVQRLRDPRFWKKLVSGKVGVVAAIGGFLGRVEKATHTGTRPGGPADATNLLERMLRGLGASKCQALVLLSGRDYVARECEEIMLPHPKFTALLRAGRATVRHVGEADHTFARHDMHALLLALTREWVIGSPPPRPSGTRTMGDKVYEE